MKKGTLIRVVVSTDFPPLDCRYPFPDQLPDDHKSDPDDLQSMVHFLLCSNEFDVEGLIASAATFAGVARKANILDMIDEYAKVYLKLAAADSDYPTPDELRAITYQGNDGTWGSEKEWDTVIGEGKDSEASRAIIDIVDKEDKRPVWFCIWGDSPSFLYLLSAAKGLSNSEDPTGESWGGQYKLLEGTKHYVDGPGAISISKWNEDIQKDFEERLALIADEIEER